MTRQLNVRDNGFTINLLISHQQRTFGSGTHNQLVPVLALEAVASSTITKYLRRRHFPVIISESPDEPPLTSIDNAILDALDKQPFSSIQELAKIMCIPSPMVDRHLTSSLGFGVKHLQ
jgi:hypothetical protein